MQPETSYADDFQSYGTQKNPTGWVDTSVGSSTPAANGLFKTWPDPLQGNKATNVVYGTKSSSGKADASGRMGIFSTLTTKNFAGKGRFEYRGRFLRADSDGRVGVTFFSSYPQKDAYYLIGLWPQSSTSKLTMRLMAFGAGTPVGTLDSGFTPDMNKWVQFLVQVDDADNATSIRARFWQDGTVEPKTFTIDAKDASSTRLSSGRIGIWSANGDSYFDDIAVKSPVNHTPPSISFFDADAQKTLDATQLALFKAPARIDVKTSGDSTVTYTAQLDGSIWTALTPISIDGTHKITVHATDASGQTADASLDLLVDQVPPTLVLNANGAAFANGAVFDKDVTITAITTDVSKVTTSAFLDNVLVALPASTADEKLHEIKVTATDQLGWSTPVTQTLYVDKSAPVISIKAGSQDLANGASFQTDVTISFSATDLTLDGVSATLDGAPFTSGTLVTSEAVHTLVVTATDKAHHTATESRSFVVDKHAPAVTLLANGQPFIAGTAFNGAVTFTVDVHDATPVTKVATLDGATYTLGTAITAQGAHTIKVVATNGSGLVTTVGPFDFTIDTTKPVVTLSESGAPFPDNAKFNRDVVPVVTATDNLTASPARALFVDGRSVDLDVPFSEEKRDHTIYATATDAAGNVATTPTFHFLLDKTKPVVTIADADGKTLKDALTNHPVVVKVRVVDLTNVTVAATLNGQSFSLGSGATQSDGSLVFTSAPIANDGHYALSVTATDEASNVSDAATANFEVDQTPPHLAFTAPPDGITVSTTTILVQGTFDDAESVTINGVVAQVDLIARTFAMNNIILLEGRNEIVATGTDKAGNSGSATLVVNLDTRAPDLILTGPPMNACINAQAIIVTGQMSDLNAHDVRVSITPGDVPPVDVIPASDGTFTASIAAPGEGKFVVSVEAADAAGHVTTGAVSVVVDRIAPSIVVTNSGAPFSGGFVNHPPSLFVRANDADPSATLTATLNGQPFVSGTSVNADGSYTLKATARDCAGNVSPETSIAFTLDTIAPRIATIDPVEGSTITTLSKPITGTFDKSDTKSLTIDGTSFAAAINGSSFTFTGVPFSDGVNRFVLVATDNAGNVSRTPYSFNVKTTTPSISITENGAPIPANAIFNRPIAPSIHSNESSATINATLDTAPYTSGTAISTEGTHTLSATASDAFGHTSQAASVTFTIDRTPPTVTIASPSDNFTTGAETIEVRGTATGGDIATVRVNSVPATVVADGSFSATVNLDLGPNVLIAAATDRAGNVGTATAGVTRNPDTFAIVLTSPADKTLTNRHSITVAGQLLTPNAASTVSINGTDVTVVNGAFVKNDFALNEGANTITATVRSSTGTPNSASVVVNADFTPPTLKVLANGAPLENDARFATSPTITVESSDTRPEAVLTTITLDGSSAASPITALADGGHALSVVVIDGAGNRARLDRTFAVGGGTATGGCSLSAFDPANGSSLYTANITISGRTGGASSVLVNNAPALMGDGSFAAPVTLQPGRNDIQIKCADSSDVTTLTLYRYTDATVTITSPTNGAISPASTINVSGTVTDGVIRGDVNTRDFIPSNGTYGVSAVPLGNGLNIITAHAKTSSGRIATASVRVKYFGGAPQLVITSPLAGTQTGASTIDVSGTYTNVDPSTIAIAGTTVQTKTLTGTTGTFTATVALAPNAKTTITVTGRSRNNVDVNTATDVTNAGTAIVTITSPLDNTALSATTAHITGTFAPILGSQVQVAGVNATTDANGNFAADVDLSAATTSSVPIVARVTTSDNQIATDAIRIIKLGALTVKDTFPSSNAIEVDSGVLIVARFSNALDGATVAGSVKLTDASGATIDGETFVDNEIVSFAPIAPLTAGMHYTFTVAQTLKDLAGSSLASPYALQFTIAASAPANPPVVDQSDFTGCITKATITGTASAPGARVRLDVDGVTLQTNSDAATGKFTFDFTLSGQPGYHIARVRQMASDGTLSAEKDIAYNINCAAPRVVAASLDRVAKKITINFSKPMKLSSLASAIFVNGNAATSVTLNAGGDVATASFTEDVTNANVALKVLKSVEDTTGQTLAADYTTTFAASSNQPTGGYVSGAVYDATNGRPLMDASVTIVSTTTTEEHGRYVVPLDEGVYTIQVTKPGYTTVWRQIVVPSGSGVVPIDIRLTKRGNAGGDTTVTKKVELTAPSGTSLTLTSVGAQSLAGLLPLGWTPAAAAEIVPLNTPIAGARLTFVLPAADVAAIAAANQTLSLAQYDETRDEWRVVTPVANVGSDGRVVFDITTTGNYALVYPDNAPNLAHPAPARTGAPLAGVANPCTIEATADVCRMTRKSFEFTPKQVVPSGRAVANLITDGVAKSFPSGTAVEAFIDEQLNLADGRVLIDPPFATDLLIYRNYAGDSGIADFHLSPTITATQNTLRDGVDHIRVVDYPGRIDRGSLIGSEGGRVPGDDGITIDIPTGATTEALHATASTITDLSQFAPIQGFRIAGAFTFSLSRADGASPVLLKPAKASFVLNSQSSILNSVIVAELLPNTPFGAVARLAAQATPIQPSYFTTKDLQADLPIDGIVRDGRYLILVADNPIAFAHGSVINGATNAAAPNARVTAANLGVVDISRAGGIFALPVPAAPAAPFSLTPRSASIGDGTTFTALTSPAADQKVDVGNLVLTAHPPQLKSVDPANGAVKNAGDPLVVTATFDVSIDATSLANAITVVDLTNSTNVPGNISSAGAVITFAGATKLNAGTRYSVTIAPTIRATNGAAFGRVNVTTFSTPALPPNDTTIHPELIRITIPDANGQSTISGKPGALPAGAQAVAVRRGNFFTTPYQATVAADKSFTFAAGGGIDRISTSDLIDLQVIDATSRAIIAVIPLTPFVTADGNGFIAPIDVTTKFTTNDGSTITVPAGAFDVPTVVTATPSAKSSLDVVPHFDDQLAYTASLDINFDGVAKKRLEVELPVPPNTDTNKLFLLGWLGQSIRGPRVMIVDTLAIANGKFTTADVSGGASAPKRASSLASRTPQTSATLTGAQAKQYLIGVERSGIYSVVDVKGTGSGGPAWGVFDGIQSGIDLFWDTLDSLFASHLYTAERGRIAIPVLPNKAFQVVGVDSSTGLTQFYKVYDPISPNDPGASSFLGAPNPPTEGPYPVFGTPFRVETAEVNTDNVELTGVRNFKITLSGGKITVADGTPALPSSLRVILLNVSNGSVDNDRSDGLSVAGEAGNHIALFIEEQEVDPSSSLSVVFSKKIFTGTSTSDDAIDVFLKNIFTLETAKDDPPPATPSWSAVPDVHYRVDSGGRRVLIDLPSSLQRGNLYRLTIDDTLADVSSGGGPGMRLGQATLASGATTNPVTLALNFRVRAPGGQLTAFDLFNSGVVRDEALNGNVLFIAAMSGGLLAYDTADPASMTTAGSLIGYAPQSGGGDVWAVASDMHGRVYSTGIGPLFGVLRSYRLEDFLVAKSNAIPSDRKVSAHAGANISFAPGSSTSLGLDSETIVSDRTEAIPRKLQILLQDREEVYETLAAFKLSPSALVTKQLTDGEFDVLKATIARDPAASYGYVGQRITVENMTLDMRWSADAWLGAPAQIDGIVARPNDRLRIVWNQRTYGVVSLFGYGIGVYDLNAIESNDDPHKDSSYKPLREQIRITTATDPAECHDASAGSIPPLPPTKIPDLTFSPEGAIVTHDGTVDLSVYAIDASRGVLDLTIHPPTTAAEAQQPSDASSSCSERATHPGLVFHTRYTQGNSVEEYFDPRIQKLRDRFVAVASPTREPFGHFSGVSYYHWTLEAKDNKVVSAPVSPNAPSLGARGSVAGTRVSRDYLLVPGDDYGLLVVEAGGTPPDASTGITPQYSPLSSQHLVDIIWIPDGCYAARAIPRTNLATVIDRKGRVLIVDLSRIDERFAKKADGTLLTPNDLFPTVAEALSGSGAYGVGKEDPRIVWKSQEGLATGTLSPFVDPDTGFLFMGKLLTATTEVIAAIDPRVQMKVELAQPGGYNEVGGIVPLGVDPPKDIKDLIAAGEPQRKADASLAAFRFELSLPGAIADALSAADNKIRVAVESERVAGAQTEQTPDGFPRAHLRVKKPNGAADPRAAMDFYFKRLVPPTQAAKLRHQKGYNKIISPWIVALADPRASIQYTPFATSSEAQKNALGCFSCTRPQFLQGKTEADDVWELFTNGRALSVRPDLCAAGTNCATNIFTGTPYAYLGKQNRLVARFATVMADTVRPLPVLVAAQAAPVAPGLMQETTYAHSGEVEASHVDMDFGGRNGWDVVIDRTYRSRTLGGTAMGQGWESSIFKRLRPMPNGDVEYRDGAGEVWLFKLNGASYDAPKGFYVTLTRTDRGYQLVDQKHRITGFDSLGRLAYECDEFVVNPDVNDKGNIVRYLYDDSGRLAQIVDPVHRSTTLSYYDDSASGVKAGLLQSITDWRNRTLDYDYNDAACLTTAKLVDVVNTSGSRPTITYDYWGGFGFSDKLELGSNLKTITDPAGGAPRVTFTYDISGADRDKVVSQTWPAPGNESISFSYGSQTTVSDAMHQSRTIALTGANTDYNSDRVHIDTITEANVPVSNYTFGELPVGGPVPAVIVATATPRTMKFGYDTAKGALTTTSIEGLRTTSYSLGKAPVGFGFRVDSETTTASIPAGGAPLSHDYEYQTPGFGDDNAITSFLKSITANGKKIETPEASRKLQTVSLNDSITNTTEYNEFGQPSHVTSGGGTDGSNVGSETKLGYVAASGAKHALGTVSSVTEVNGAETLTTQIDYKTPSQIVTTDPRNVTTTTDLDAWDRPTHVVVSGPNLTTDEKYTYDANGRVKAYVRKQDDKTVTTTYEYDVLGRETSTSVDNVDVNGSPGTVTTTTKYDLGATTPTITRTLPKGAVATDELDALGRVTKRTTTTGSSTPIINYFGYDLAGNVVYASDNFTATATAYDVHGRLLGTANADGTRTIASGHDGWGNPQEVSVKATTGASVAHTSLNFTPAGRLDSSTTDLGTTSLQTTTKWDGAGRATVSSAADRVTKSRFDALGRFQSTEYGSASTTFQKIEAASPSSYSGHLLTGAKMTEKAAPKAVEMTYEHDALGNVTRNTLGALAWEQNYDQSGNVTSAHDPGRPATTYKHDARGNVTDEQRADASSLKHKYDAAGGSKAYVDPSEATTTEADLLGRPVVRTYPDQTTETFGYEASRLTTYKDRQGRSFVYEYEPNTGRLQFVRRQGGEPLEKYSYDDGGRLHALTTADAEIAFENYDLGGRPHLTKQTRFGTGANGGFGTRTVVDEYTQTHDYNEHGERTMFTMPYAGNVNGWSTQINLDRDAAGNVTQIRRTVAGGVSAVMMTADYRNSGRPIVRNITTECAAAAPCVPITLGRAYGYDEVTGQLNEMKVTGRAGAVIAGTHVTYDGPSLQVHRAELLGISGSRGNEFTYDSRGRLQTSVFAKPAGSVPAIEQLTPSDFRNGIARTTTEPTDPPSVSYTLLPGKKIATFTRGGNTRVFDYANGAERRDDGRYTYEFDTRGRLTTITEKTPTNARRILYFYGATDRIVGRRAEYALAPGTFVLEDRSSVLASDGLPAETTFVWDPISDQLLAVFRKGAGGDLLRQIIHGGAAYDDPIEVTIADPGSGALNRVYPIYDEAAAGSLQAITNANGDIISRALTEGAYGEEESALGGVGVDQIAVKITKSSGTLSNVEVTIRVTESLAAATVAAGGRLAAVLTNGTVVRSAPTTPTLFDNNTLRWTLTPSEWTTLTAPPATALSVAVTNTLRAESWSATSPILPPPTWALPTRSVFTSAALPLEYRESLVALGDWIATAPSPATRTIYEIHSLSALSDDVAANGRAMSAQRLIMAAGFQALPFQEPATGLVFARARWLDTSTGSFLSPDPLYYKDSSNLYAFAGGDPVNGRDPSGKEASIGRNGWIVATDNRHGGRIVRFSPAEISKDPQKVRTFLGLNADVDPREADAMIERAGAAWATGGDKMRQVAPGAAKAAGVYPLMAVTAGAGIGGGVGAVAAGELGLGFVGSSMLPGFTGGVGSQAGGDIQAGHFSGVRQYAISGSTGAVGSLVVGTVFVGGQRLIGFGTPDVFPSIMPEGGWPFPEPPAVTPLRRPYKRVAFCRSVECAAIRTPEGLPIDPNTGEVIEGEYHFGHKYGYEHRRLVREAQAKGMTQKEFNDWINSHPEWFQLEAPANNVSHRFEKPGVD